LRAVCLVRAITAKAGKTVIFKYPEEVAFIYTKKHSDWPVFKSPAQQNYWLKSQ
jgi:hypothetical protein